MCVVFQPCLLLITLVTHVDVCHNTDLVKACRQDLCSSNAGRTVKLCPHAALSGESRQVVVPAVGAGLALAPKEEMRRGRSRDGAVGVNDEVERVAFLGASLCRTFGWSGLTRN